MEIHFFVGVPLQTNYLPLSNIKTKDSGKREEYAEQLVMQPSSSGRKKQFASKRQKNVQATKASGC